MRKSGYYDKNGQEYQTGQRVKLNLPYADTDHYIYGTIVYGLYVVGTDEWEHKYITIGFAVSYIDGSGTTGLNPEWEITTEKEFQEHLLKIKNNILNVPQQEEKP